MKVLEIAENLLEHYIFVSFDKWLKRLRNTGVEHFLLKKRLSFCSCSYVPFIQRQQPLDLLTRQKFIIRRLLKVSFFCIIVNKMSSHSWCICWPFISVLFLASAPNIFDNRHQDPTGMTALLQSTDLVGVVHTLYCILLHSFLPESASQSQEPYGPGVVQVALQGIRFLNSFALLDLCAFQVFLYFL